MGVKYTTTFQSKGGIDMAKRLTTTALILNILASAFYITFLALSIIDKDWIYAVIALCLFICHTVLVKEIKKRAKAE